MSHKEPNSEFRFLASIANHIKEDFKVPDDPWAESDIVWIKNLAPGSKGRLGVNLIRAWCGAKGLSVDFSGDPEADLLINSHRVEIKFSTLWKSGIYKFQQLRDQNYAFAVCLGVSPFDAHCWVISKEILLQNVIGHTPQHTGASGTETFWFSVIPDEPQDWLQECGGTLDQAFGVLKGLSRR